MNDLARDFYLSKPQSEVWLLGFNSGTYSKKMYGSPVLEIGRKTLLPFFNMVNKFCYCTNKPGLFTSLVLPHNLSDWSLFIDSSKKSFKAVFLHNGNKYPSILIVHAVHIKLGLMNNFVMALVKMILPSNTCLLCYQILVLLSSKRASEMH